MISISAHQRRRHQLRQSVQGPILLLGVGQQARNLPMNHLPFRQDSTFLYYTGCSTPNAALLIDRDEEFLFLPSTPPDDELWHGPTPSLSERAAALGFEQAIPTSELSSVCQRIVGDQPLKTLAISDPKGNQLLQSITGQPHIFGQKNGSNELIEAVIKQRRVLEDEEFDELRGAMKHTKQAHLAAMECTRPGGTEQEVAWAFESTIRQHGLDLAYQSIVTVDGHILHNHSTHNTLQSGQLLLLDGGAEARSGYATDITRTWPVSGAFTGRQRAAYDAVLESQLAAINLLRPGTRYRDVHLAACSVLAQFLIDEGLLRCSAEEAVERGAHALFFPHGIGHLLGLDVHDLENFGDRAAYPAGRARSDQFGLSYLRLDLTLTPNMAVTIEPGLYIAPAILKHKALVDPLRDLLNLEQIESWVGFGGIRIEDDVRITEDEPEVLSESIAKDPSIIETLVGGFSQRQPEQ